MIMGGAFFFFAVAAAAAPSDWNQRGELQHQLSPGLLRKEGKSAGCLFLAQVVRGNVKPEAAMNEGEFPAWAGGEILRSVPGTSTYEVIGLGKHLS